MCRGTLVRMGLVVIAGWSAAVAQEAAAPPPVVIDAAEFSSLQAALDALPPAGGLVRLPPGTFEIDQPLVLSTPETRLEGAGAATHIRNRNTSGAPALLVRPPTRDADPRARLWRVQLGNLRLSGNEASGDGIRAEGINELFVHGVSVDHHGGCGLALIDCYEDPRIADSIFTYNKSAGVLIEAGHDVVVSANHFEENEDALVCRDSFNLCMTGNNIDDHLRHGVVIENTYGSVVSGNMIEECQGTAIILDRDCYGITLSANVIAHDMGGGIDLRDAHGCAVSANTFTLVHHFSVRVGPGSGRVTIAANNFCNSHIGGGEKRKLVDPNPVQLDVGHGVVLEDARHVTVMGNTFAGLDGPAVVAQGTTAQVLISGNVVTDVHRRTPAASPRAPFELGPQTRVTLGENLTE